MPRNKQRAAHENGWHQQKRFDCPLCWPFAKMAEEREDKSMKCKWCGGSYGDPQSRYCGNCGVMPACGLTIAAHNEECVGEREHSDEPVRP